MIRMCSRDDSLDIKADHRGASLLFLRVATCLIVLGMLGFPVSADEEPEVYYVPDVEAQFAAIVERADAMGFDRGGSPDPSSCKHYQGIARSHGPGVPYFFVTRSGNDTICASDDDPGNLLIVQMGSRGTSGERLRSNRLVSGTETDDSMPDPADTTVAYVTFDGTGSPPYDWPNYGHPGGVQLVDDVLVVPLETPYGDGPENLILIVDVSNPTAPEILSDFAPLAKAGLVAIAPEPDGTYLLLVTGGENEKLTIYRSEPNTPDGGTDLTDSNLNWTLVDHWLEDTDETDLGGGHDWPTNPFGSVPVNAPHQTLNFIREDGPDGQLYLLGARNKGGGAGGAGIDEDKIDLYRVEWEGSQFKLKWVMTKEITAKGTSSTFHDGNMPDDVANLAASGNFYVSPSGELIFYATEHDNDGPGGTVKMGEWRHRDMVRPNSPTYDPTPVPGGPFSVPEGGPVLLNGLGEPPVTSAWIELYADPGYTDRSLPVIYDDWHLDDYDDFKELDDGDTVSGFSDQASSWRWFAPVGCSILARDNHIGDGLGNKTKTLAGTGSPESATELKNVSNDSNDDDMNDGLTAVQFLSDCDAYYASPIAVDWDLDLNGSFEADGTNVIFSAAGLDGPSIATVAMRARHPIDGRSRNLEVPVEITNVSPSVDSVEARDSLGLLIPQEVPVAIVGLPVAISATFTDPGTPDHQTAIIVWGDGSFDASGTFESFSDAFGGVVGQLEHSHVYGDPDEYTVTVGVQDDDLGYGDADVVIEVASLADAVEAAADELALLIQQGWPSPIRQQLENALKALNGPQGAVARFDGENPRHGINRVVHALLKLEQIAGSVDIGTIPQLLVQVCKAAAVIQIADAEAVASKPIHAQKIAKAEQHVAEGDALVASEHWFDGGRAYYEAFKSADFQ